MSDSGHTDIYIYWPAACVNSNLAVRVWTAVKLWQPLNTCLRSWGHGGDLFGGLWWVWRISLYCDGCFSSMTVAWTKASLERAPQAVFSVVWSKQWWNLTTRYKMKLCWSSREDEQQLAHMATRPQLVIWEGLNSFLVFWWLMYFPWNVL